MKQASTHRACVIDTAARQVMYGNGQVTDVGENLVHDLLQILDGTTGRFAEQATVIVSGVPLALFATQSAKVKAAGWNHSTVTPWTTFHRSDGRVISLGVRAAFTGNQVDALFPRNTDNGVAAVTLDRYHQLTGVAWRGTYVTTAMAGMRLTCGNAWGEPLWSLPPDRAKRGAGEMLWSRSLNSYETEWGFVHTFDGNSAYLGAMITGEFAWSTLHQVGPQPFNPNLPGYWEVLLSDETYARCVDPTAPPLLDPRRITRQRTALMTTPMAKLLHDLGDPCHIIDSVTGKSGVTRAGKDGHPAQSRVLRPWAENMRDARKATRGGPLEEPIKRTYADATGGLQRAGMRVARPDWAHTVIDQWRATMYRTMLRIRHEQGVWPVAVKVDALSYADCSDSPDILLAALNGSKRRTALGAYDHQATTSTADWAAAHAPKTRKVSS